MILGAPLQNDARAAGISTLVELLEYRAARQPHDVVFRFINGDGTEDGLLTFGEQHAFGVRPRRFIGEAHHRNRWIEPRPQLLAVRFHVCDRLLRDAGAHRGFGDGRGDHFH